MHYKNLETQFMHL